jgi:hypothetical protein
MSEWHYPGTEKLRIVIEVVDDDGLPLWTSEPIVEGEGYDAPINVAGHARAVGIVTDQPDVCLVFPEVFGNVEVVPGNWVHILAGWFWSRK